MGVNLAVQDVLLSSVRFNTQDRRRRARSAAVDFLCVPQHGWAGGADSERRCLRWPTCLFMVDRFLDPYHEIVRRYYVEGASAKKRAVRQE